MFSVPVDAVHRHGSISIFARMRKNEIFRSFCSRKVTTLTSNNFKSILNSILEKEALSYSNTDHAATFMRVKDDYMENGQLMTGYTCIRCTSKSNRHENTTPFIRCLKKVTLSYQSISLRMPVTTLMLITNQPNEKKNSFKSFSFKNNSIKFIIESFLYYSFHYE